MRYSPKAYTKKNRRSRAIKRIPADNRHVYLWPARKRPERTSQALFVPLDMFNEMRELAAKHLPEPTFIAWCNWLLGEGMDEYERGAKPDQAYVTRPYFPEKIAYVNYVYRFDIHTDRRFKTLGENHDPPTGGHIWFEYLIHLGLKKYRREYHFGVKKT